MIWILQVTIKLRNIVSIAHNCLIEHFLERRESDNEIFRRDEEEQNDRWVNDPRNDDANCCIIYRRKFGLRPRRDQKRQPRGSSMQRTIEMRLTRRDVHDVPMELSDEF